MRILAQRISNQKNVIRLLQWGKLVAITGSAQVAIQGIGFLSGILVIRLLPTSEYALYTLANTMLGTMLILADGGITSGVLSEGSKVWQDPGKFGSVIATGFRLRRRFAVFSLSIAIPVLYYLLSNHGASLIMTVLIILCLIPAFITSLSGALLELGPKLKQEVVELQRIQMITSLARLTLNGTFLLSFPLTWLALIASGLPQLYGNFLLKKASKSFLDYKQNPNKEVEKTILRIVSRVMPGSIYYCFSTQITIWLITIFGNTNSIAHMGALARLGMFLAILTALFNTLILPRFAKLPPLYSLLIRRVFQLQIGLFIVSAIIVGICWVFSSEVLWLLGNEYQNLNMEVVLNIIGTCLSLIAGITFSLISCRGWAINPVLSIGINVSTIILGAVLFDLSTLGGILTLNIFVAFAQVLMNLIFLIIQIRKLKLSQDA